MSKRRPAFRSFRARGPLTFADHWTAKGVLGAELDLGADRSLCLFATHLQADRRRPGENATVRARQLTEVRQFATGFMRGVAPERRSAALLVGDLNVEGETAGGRRPTREYRTLRARLGEARDLFREANPTAPGFTWNVDASAPGADPRQAPQRLDYAFAWRALASGASLTNLRTRTVDLDPGLSDHRGLAVELALAARPSTSVVPDLFVTDSIAALSHAR